MNRSNQTIVEYLLGELSETDASALEQEYFAEPEFFDQVVEAENELVDRYARGQLSPRMHERFESYYLAHHTRRDRAKFAAALAKRLDQKRESPSTSAQTESWWSRLLASMQRPRLVLSFSLALLLLIAGVVWFAMKTRERAAQAQRERDLQQQLAVEQARSDQVVSQLDRRRDEPKAAQPSPTPPPQKAAAVATLVLNISGVRGAETGPPATLAIASGTEQARIQLNLSDNDYSRYSVVIQSADGKQVFERGGLQSRNKTRASLTVIVSAGKLPTGDYILTLKGSTQDGEVEDVSKSLFRVEKR